jgi:lysophospholipase L1-like esterase
MPKIRRIVAYGDSLTYGWIPNPNPPSERYGPDGRWPGVLQKELGSNFQVIEEGLDGRTTDAPDPGSPISGAQLDGSAYIQACLASHLPVDLVVIMLGSNDLKPVFNRTPLRYARNLRIKLQTKQPEINLWQDRAEMEGDVDAGG